MSEIDEVQEAARRLQVSFEADLTPTLLSFMTDQMSANELRHRVLTGYEAAVTAFDVVLSDALGRVVTAEQAVGPSAPEALPEHEALLRFYPLSISSHNLGRLVEVLAEELGDRTASQCAMPQRVQDLGAILDQFDLLYLRLLEGAAA